MAHQQEKSCTDNY